MVGRTAKTIKQKLVSTGTTSLSHILKTYQQERKIKPGSLGGTL
jgi:hypothetical protein